MALKPVTASAPYSTAVIKQQITCQTEEAKGFLGHRLGTLSVALFILDVTSRKRIARLNLSQKEHKAASKALNKLFNDFEKDIADETARIEAVLKAQKITARAEHNNPGSATVEITTPELRRAMEILLSFDNLIILVDTAWLMGIMDTEVANTYRKQKTSQFRNLLSNIYKLSKAAKASAFIKDDEEAKAAIAREEEKHGGPDAEGAQPEASVDEPMPAAAQGKTGEKNEAA